MRSDAASRACGLWELARTVYHFPERLERVQKQLRCVGASDSKSLAGKLETKKAVCRALLGIDYH